MNTVLIAILLGMTVLSLVLCLMILRWHFQREAKLERVIVRALDDWKKERDKSADQVARFFANQLGYEGNALLELRDTILNHTDTVFKGMISAILTAPDQAVLNLKNQLMHIHEPILRAKNQYKLLEEIEVRIEKTDEKKPVRDLHTENDPTLAEDLDTVEFTDHELEAQLDAELEAELETICAEEETQAEASDNKNEMHKQVQESEDAVRSDQQKDAEEKSTATVDGVEANINETVENVQVKKVQQSDNRADDDTGASKGNETAA